MSRSMPYRSGDRVVAMLGDSRIVGALRAVGDRHVIIDPYDDKTGHTIQVPPWELFMLSPRP